MLQIYNSLSQKKEPFVPRTTGEVGMYVCGVTVYDYCHIGHARTYAVFDVIFRYLQILGYRVKYVRNITDIDDKIIHRAQNNNESCAALTQRFIAAMHEDFDALGFRRPSVEPKATETLQQMITLIEQLMTQGVAYLAENGDVYFDVGCYQDYGILAQQEMSSLQAGARIDINTLKRQPLDFVLWKRATADEVAWPSPWGQGRPGWHIECSAMAAEHLGSHFDLHGGGMDLKFPHHENERAQSEASSGQKYVNYWMHTGFVQVQQQKMSKSLHNFFTIREVLAEFDAETVRYFLLSSHYRSPINYSHSSLQHARASLETLYLALRDITPVQGIDPDSSACVAFRAAMNDDFNTPVALAVLFELAKNINVHKTSCPSQAASYAGELIFLADILGICQQVPEQFLQHGVSGDVNYIETLLRHREQARNKRDWAEADRVRAELDQMGVVIEDSKDGTRWRWRADNS